MSVPSRRRAHDPVRGVGEVPSARPDARHDSLDAEPRTCSTSGPGRGLLALGAAKRLTTGTAVGIDVWSPKDLTGNTADAFLANAEAEGVAERVEVRNADARSMPFPDASFDVILSNVCLHNIADAGGPRRRVPRDRAGPQAGRRRAGLGLHPDGRLRALVRGGRPGRDAHGAARLSTSSRPSGSCGPRSPPPDSAEEGPRGGPDETPRMLGARRPEASFRSLATCSKARPPKSAILEDVDRLEGGERAENGSRRRADRTSREERSPRAAPTGSRQTRSARREAPGRPRAGGPRAGSRTW